MEHRYELFSHLGVRNIDGYNAQVMKSQEPEKKMPYIVVIVDELADLMMVASSEVEDCIMRLAQMARAAGIHMIIATQRPSVDVITGIIKANIPSRIAFAVSSQIDSRTILDTGGAEKLLGRGDMLYLPIGQNKPIRIQGAYISDAEVERIVTYVASQQQVEYDEEMLLLLMNLMKIQWIMMSTLRMRLHWQFNYRLLLLPCCKEDFVLATAVRQESLIQWKRSALLDHMKMANHAKFYGQKMI